MASRRKNVVNVDDLALLSSAALLRLRVEDAVDSAALRRTRPDLSEEERRRIHEEAVERLVRIGIDALILTISAREPR